MCGDAATVHLGSTLEEIEQSELAMWNGHVADKPFVILAQPTVIDPTRAPAGRHTAWAYAHVPHGWEGDITDAIEGQVERFAPGFSTRIIHRTISSPADLENANANLLGGDIGMGAFSVLNMIRRPRFGLYPHRIGRGVYLASAAASPGPGLHGMAGYRAARTAMRDHR
ncbi:MAG TPA: NAD(P)/FAD-dependent oxidoreductase [Actinobacteria bacterium]|nr:NAD(P)/FAD-dependent oxidoreductase [Actinomycetota bacterium]